MHAVTRVYVHADSLIQKCTYTKVCILVYIVIDRGIVILNTHKTDMLVGIH